METKPPSSPSLLETYLQDILDRLDSQDWTLEALFKALRGHGYPLLIILLVLPFCQPIQIPGFSTPFGLVIVFIGLRMAWGKRIPWPQWILRRRISPPLLRNIIDKSLWFIRALKPLLHIRWSRLCIDPFLYRLHGYFVILMGLYLTIPFPIPFSNLLVSWALLFLGLGLLEDDGLFVCLGYAIGGLGMFVLGFLIFWLGRWIF